MATAGDIIKRSMRLIGAIGSSETPSSAEQADGLVALNAMIEGWDLHYKMREEFTLTSGQQARTIGATGNFVSARPVVIERAGIEDQSSSDTPEHPLEIINVQQWANIAAKGVQSQIPTKLYVEETYPDMNLNLWPVPSAANKLVLYSIKALTTFASAATTVSVPPGYEEALAFNLALRLAPEFGRTPSELVVAFAEQSLSQVKRRNTKPSYLRVDDALLGADSYNIYTGE